MKVKRVVNRIGMTGPDVHAVNRARARAGFGPAQLSLCRNVYSSDSRGLTAKFQKAHGLSQDGWVGQQTLDALAPFFDQLAKAWYSAAAMYVNPFRLCQHFVPERTDQGVDGFAELGAAAVAIGSMRVTRATTTAGWVGGGCVQGVLIDEGAACNHHGEEVYLAEFVTPNVRVGQILEVGQVKAHFNRGYQSGVGMEYGWVRRGTFDPCNPCVPDNADCQPTPAGIRMNRWLHQLGCPVLQSFGPGPTTCPC